MSSTESAPQYIILLSFTILITCKETDNIPYSKESQLYGLAFGEYKLNYKNEKTSIFLDLLMDSTFLLRLPSTRNDELKGKWFLSDSLLVLDVLSYQGRDCLSGEVYDEIDSTSNIQFCWKLIEIDSVKFTCKSVKRKFRKKIITAEKIMK